MDDIEGRGIMLITNHRAFYKFEHQEIASLPLKDSTIEADVQNYNRHMNYNERNGQHIQTQRLRVVLVSIRALGNRSCGLTTFKLSTGENRNARPCEFTNNYVH